jgi:succinate dehydrogenase / fumarate reductase iron-sulfur subunit
MGMSTWTVTYRVYRQQGRDQPRFDQFRLEVRPDEYLLDGIERIWAFHDRSLTFRHACHHSTCGACGMRVDGVEKLTCITRIRDVTRDGGTITVEPLRNFPVVGDLAVDMSPLYATMEQVGARQLTPVEAAPNGHGPAPNPPGSPLLRLVDCIECGLCMSACPVMATAQNYLGPAPLAAIQHQGAEPASESLARADSQDGLWRCHNTFECAAVCPSWVDPAARLMGLRRQIVGQRVKRLFRREKEARQ